MSRSRPASCFSKPCGSGNENQEKIEARMNLEWYDWVGLLGSLLVVGSYFLLQSGRLSGTGLPYQLINIAGSSFILV